MDKKEFLSQLRSFLKESETFAGITFQGMYDMDNECFFDALEHYLDTGENVLDEYSEIQWLSWGNFHCSGDFEYYDKDKRDKILKYLAQENYWNLYYVASEDRIEEIKHNLERSKSRDEHRKGYKYRRQQACIFTSNPTVRKKIFKRDGKVCKSCNSTENLSLDHIIPVSTGGEDELENLQVLCKSCNSSKGGKLE
jgi:hypothetical protein